MAQEEHDAERGPHLHPQRFGADPYDGLDLDVLLEHSEKQLDLPPVLIDGRDGRRAKRRGGWRIVPPASTTRRVPGSKRSVRAPRMSNRRFNGTASECC